MTLLLVFLVASASMAHLRCQNQNPQHHLFNPEVGRVFTRKSMALFLDIFILNSAILALTPLSHVHEDITSTGAIRTQDAPGVWLSHAECRRLTSDTIDFLVAQKQVKEAHADSI